MVTITKTTQLWTKSEAVEPIKNFLKDMPKIDCISYKGEYDQCAYDTIKCQFNEDDTKLIIKLSIEDTLDQELEFSVEDLHFEAITETSSDDVEYGGKSYVIHNNSEGVTIWLEK